MSSIQLIAVETALLVSTMAFIAWVGEKAHRGAMQVYSGVVDGARLSRPTRRLVLVSVYGGLLSISFVTTALVALAFLQIGVSTASPEAANMAYLFALALFLFGGYLLINGVMTIFGLAKMIERGLRAERA